MDFFTAQLLYLCSINLIKIFITLRNELSLVNFNLKLHFDKIYVGLIFFLNLKVEFVGNHLLLINTNFFFYNFIQH